MFSLVIITLNSQFSIFNSQLKIIVFPQESALLPWS